MNLILTFMFKIVLSRTGNDISAEKLYEKPLAVTITIEYNAWK